MLLGENLAKKMQLNLGSLQTKTTPKRMLSKNVALRCFRYFHIFDAVRFIDNLVDQAQDSPWRCVARTEDERWKHEMMKPFGDLKGTPLEN